MNKKKVATLLVAGALTVSIVGGTLAWFTSKESIPNKFSTPGATDGNTTENSGVKIHENFDEAKAQDITPGTDVTKEVQVHSTVNYDQFIRVKITPEFTDKDGKVVTENQGKTLENKKIDLNLINYSKTDLSSGSWFDGGDGYYYYIGKVAPGSYTETLLKSVKLDSTAGNEYKGLNFNVKVDAEGVQASNAAYLDSWNLNNEKLKDAFKNAEGASQPKLESDIIKTIPKQ